MTSLRASPDFGALTNVRGYTLFPSIEELDRFFFLPDGLEVAPREQAPQEPDFRVEFVRGQSPFLPPGPYGLLDFRVRSVAFSDEALSELRKTSARAVTSPALFARGFLRLRPIAGTDPAAAEFGDAIALASNGLDSLRVMRRTSGEGASLLKRVLCESTLSFLATAELELAGVAPRLRCRLEFRAGDLFTALNALADDQKRLKSARLADFWMQDVNLLPVRPVAGFDSVDRSLLGQVLADWSAAEFTEMTASVGESVEPTVRLLPLASPDRIVAWDLMTWRTVPRIFVMALDPFDAARQVVAARGLDSIFTETVVPPLQTGFVSISVASNLPQPLQGVVKLGVNLMAPPTPPLRVQALTETVLFDDPSKVTAVQWRFSPREPVTYQYTTFAILGATGGTKRITGETINHDGNYLLLGVTDFPLHFVPVKAHEVLLNQATVEGACRYHDTSGPIDILFTLTIERPSITLALPAEISEAVMSLTAVSIKSDAQIAIGEFPASGVTLDLFSLREYGAHTVWIEGVFDRNAPLLAVELLPEAAPEQPENIGVAAVTPNKPTAEWSYFAGSPFEGGYRYRRVAGDGHVSEWSGIRMPFDRLKLMASEFV